MQLYGRMKEPHECQCVARYLYSWVGCILAVFCFSVFTLSAAPICPNCGNKTVSTENGIICNHCGYSSKAVFCDHSGACNCATSSNSASIDDENYQLLKTYGDFLTDDQSSQLSCILGTGQSYRPLFLEWGLIQSRFPVVINSPLFDKPPWDDSTTTSQDSVSFSPASFVLANGGLQQNFDDIDDSDTDWYESLSALISNLMEHGVSPEEPLINSVCRLLQEDHFVLSDTPLPALACSGSQLQVILAVVNESMVYFHGLSVKDDNLLYFIPGSGVYLINIDLLEEMLEELKNNALISVFTKSKTAQKR